MPPVSYAALQLTASCAVLLLLLLHMQGGPIVHVTCSVRAKRPREAPSPAMHLCYGLILAA